MTSFSQSLAAVKDFLSGGGSLHKLEVEHGIASKSDGRHLILDYDQLAVKWDSPFGYACRGLVLDAATLEVLAAPLKKFFNYGEHYADAVDFKHAVAFEKIDGTMVNRWWSPHTEKFEYSTRFQLPDGLAVTAVNSGIMTWQNMIDRCMASFDPAILDSQPKEETWTFEVCSPHNMVVVRHSAFYAKLLAIKNNITLTEKSVGKYHPHSPRGYTFSSGEEVLVFANSHPATELEGFVVVDENFNRIKIKSDQYVHLHRMKDGLNGINNLILLARSNDYGEVVAHFPQFKQDLDTAANIIADIVREHETAYNALKDIPSQKDFAIAVNSKGLLFTGSLFAVRSGKASDIKQSLLAVAEPAFCRLVKERIFAALNPGALQSDKVA